MAPMSHRERVMAALNHQPDRVPMDLGALSIRDRG